MQELMVRLFGPLWRDSLRSTALVVLGCVLTWIAMDYTADINDALGSRLGRRLMIVRALAVTGAVCLPITLGLFLAWSKRDRAR